MKQDRLRAVIVTKKSNFLSFLTRKDVYSEEKLRADEEALRQFYFNNGFADFRIISAEAVLDEAVRADRRADRSIQTGTWQARDRSCWSRTTPTTRR